MTEQQILKKIESFNENDKIRAIVDFIENLPIEQRTTPVLGELGRAYNNLYWFDSTEKNKDYLRKAIEIFKYIEEEEKDTAIWNYRIGYSYFYLNQIDEAKKHFQKYEEISGEKEEFLEIIEISQKYNISLEEAFEGGKGGVEYTLDRILMYLKENASDLVEILDDGVTDEYLQEFDNQHDIKLTEGFKQLHRTFSGQKQENLILGEQRFVGLKEVAQIQEDWLNFVKKHYGENWQEVKLENFSDEILSQNQLFNPKWIPILTGEYMLCVDFDEGDGQVIMVNLAEKLEDFEVSHLFDSVREWVEFLDRSLKSGYISYDAENHCLKFNQENQSYLYKEEEVEALESYIDKIFGKFNDVFHELVSPDIHCDIYIIEPTPECNYYTLVTGGMGAYSMPVSESENSFAELVIYLPPDWKIKSADEKDYWPIRWLKILARLPITEGAYLDAGHTIPAGKIIEGTGFDCIMLLNATEGKDEEGDFIPAKVMLPTGKKINFYTLVPLYPQETLYKLNYSANELMDKFIEAEIPYPPVVDVHRVNSCADFQPKNKEYILDGIAWAFNGVYYRSLMSFLEDVKQYNLDIGNIQENFNPFATIFKVPKVKLIYDAYIRGKEDILENETLLNPDTLQKSSEGNLHYAEILAELYADDDNQFGAIDFLLKIHNTLCNKDLGDRIFFEGIEIHGYEEDGTPAIGLLLGS